MSWEDEPHLKFLESKFSVLPVEGTIEANKSLNEGRFNSFSTGLSSSSSIISSPFPPSYSSLTICENE